MTIDEYLDFVRRARDRALLEYRQILDTLPDPFSPTLINARAEVGIAQRIVDMAELAQLEVK
jgi:hypothetical protein